MFTVSIPQAVGAVATDADSAEDREQFKRCFNTASGRCCCNKQDSSIAKTASLVSIPQAVGAVATEKPAVRTH